MAWKTILVHLDDTDRVTARLDLAVALARRADGRVIGLFAENEPGLPMLGSHGPGPALREAARRSERRFADTLAASGVAGSHHAVLAIGEAYVTRQVIGAARHADLVLLGQHDAGHHAPTVPRDLAEQVALHGGRPVVVMPYAGNHPALEGHALIAWNGGREAARALHDAMPLIDAAGAVTVLDLEATAPDRAPDDTDGAAPFTDIVRTLATRGVPATRERMGTVQVPPAELMLSRAADLGATLLVMGAHGHYGYPHLHRGGATRQILRHMTLPVLLSH